MVRGLPLLLACLLLASPAGARQGDRPSEQEMLAVFRAAVEHQQAGRLAEAEAEFRRFLRWQPYNPEALANLGVIYVTLGRYDDAVASYRKALERLALSAPIRMNLALAYYKSGRCALAVPEFERVLEISPGHFSAQLLEADCLLQLGAYAKAIALLRPLADTHGDDRAFNYVLGLALLRNDETEAGLLHLDRILKDGDSAESRLMMGVARRSAMDNAGALEEFRRALELNPKLPLAHSLYGQALLASGDRPGARDAFLKELAINPHDFESNLLMGVMLKEDRRFDEARPYLEHARSVRPADPAARYQMATLLLGSGRTDEALAILEPLVEESPAFVEARVSLATAYYRLKRKADGDRQREIVAKLTAEAQARQPGGPEPQP